MSFLGKRERQLFRDGGSRDHYFGSYTPEDCWCGEVTRGPFNLFSDLPVFFRTIWFLFSLAGVDQASYYYDQ